MLPKKFFVTSGAALSKVSVLNSFDKALKEAGIHQYNIVLVSSIIPEGAEEIEPVKLPIGSIVFCVMAREDGVGGETISAGLAYAWDKSRRYGIIAEEHMKAGDGGIRQSLRDKIREMAEIRDMDIMEPKLVVRSLDVPDGHYGTVVVAAVFVL